MMLSIVHSGFRSDRGGFRHCTYTTEISQHLFTSRRGTREDGQREANNNFSRSNRRWLQCPDWVNLSKPKALLFPTLPGYM